MDTELVIQAQGGDQVAFATLVTTMGERLTRVAVAILRDRTLAEEAIQQAVVNVWRDLPRLRDPARFEAWSYRLVVNACYGEARRGRHLPNALAVGVSEPVVPDGVAIVADRDQLERGFRRLSVDQRSVVVLSFLVGLSPNEVADVLGLPVGTVHSRLHRALRTMRASLEADERPGVPAEAHPVTR